MKTNPAHAANSQDCNFRNIYRAFTPFPTLKCVGRPLFRNRHAREYACMLDLDPDVVSWRCVTEALVNDSSAARPGCWNVDFAVETESEALLVEVRQTTTGGPAWLPEIVEKMGYRHQAVSVRELDQNMLENSKDLMRYIGSEVPLGDRVRLLAGLDEMGSLTLAECLTAIRESRPMHTVAAMILNGMLEVDLSQALLGPDTIVRRAKK